MIDRDIVRRVTADLDLREPNRIALETVVLQLHAHETRDGYASDTFEGVIDSAVGVGKTYIMAACIDYFAEAQGIRDFAVVVPGQTILQKTLRNFSEGDSKSLLPGMDVRPVLITSENFRTPAFRSVMEDDEQVRLYLFTVQSLLKPTTKAHRRTHKYQETLGEAFYDHLSGLSDLIVFADEHHVYDARKFSAAIRDLKPRALIGLTGTPTNRMEDRVIYRYPLAAAIADQYVKTPVIVGRRDDRDDAKIKLLDGVRLLDLKQESLDRYCEARELPSVNAVMLVVAQSIEEAGEYAALLESENFEDGRFVGRVLEIHSKSADEELAKLDAVENPDSSVRVIVAVDKLKEGWDVKNVYVIASMRASVSKILTEQTLGRGLRLPFGGYLGNEFLDSLEVLAHESYDKLLKDKKILSESFIDHRSHSVIVEDREGTAVVREEHSEIANEVVVTEDGTSVPQAPTVTSVESRTTTAQREAKAQPESMSPLEGVSLRIPRLTMRQVANPFSLADIVELGPFSALGRRLASDPEGELRRTLFSAKRVDGPDGLPSVRIVRREAADRIDAVQPELDLGDQRDRLSRLILAADQVPARASEHAHLKRLLDAFYEGLGDDGVAGIGAHLDRAAARLLDLITAEQRKQAPKPRIEEDVEFLTFAPVRVGKTATSEDRLGPFKRGVGYVGWAKSMYAQVWFDSSTERDVANALDRDDAITTWVRLHRNDLPILWSNTGRNYNPDFVAVEADNEHYLIEVKADKDVESADVVAKAEAAKRWANRVDAAPGFDGTWRYLLVSESDVAQAKNSWPALKKLGR